MEWIAHDDLLITVEKCWKWRKSPFILFPVVERVQELASRPSGAVCCAR